MWFWIYSLQSDFEISLQCDYVNANLTKSQEFSKCVNFDNLIFSLRCNLRLSPSFDLICSAIYLYCTVPSGPPYKPTLSHLGPPTNPHCPFWATLQTRTVPSEPPYKPALSLLGHPTNLHCPFWATLQTRTVPSRPPYKSALSLNSGPPYKPALSLLGHPTNPHCLFWATLQTCTVPSGPPYKPAK